MRVGQGFDVHRFGEGDHVVLGGVKIPCAYGLIAHSDGDVLLHAVCDALLGAVGAGDIGHHFPDSDAQWQGVSSLMLLAECHRQVRNRGFRLGNLDSCVIAQTPRCAPHIDTMRANIAEVLETELERINVKATTTERLGFTGREEGIAAQVVVLLEPMQPIGC